MLTPPPPRIIERLWQDLVLFVNRVNQGALTFIREGGTQQIHVTSWWRSPADNARVSGHPESQHLVGLAADLAVEPQQIEQLANALRRVGLVVVVYDRHVHVQHNVAGFIRSIGWHVAESGELVDQFGRAV